MVKEALGEFWKMMHDELDLQNDELGKKDYQHEYAKTRQVTQAVVLPTGGVSADPFVSTGPGTRDAR